VALVGEMRNSYKILAGISIGKRPLGRGGLKLGGYRERENFFEHPSNC
jgi:hypothetical protein